MHLLRFSQKYSASRNIKLKIYAIIKKFKKNNNKKNGKH